MSAPEPDPTTTLGDVVRGDQFTVATFYDPCLPSGTTQYGIVPCDPPAPAELPQTGTGLTLAVIATILVTVGVQLRKFPKRRHTPTRYNVLTEA